MKNTGQQYARDSSRSTSGLRAFIGLLCWCAVLTASANAQVSVLNFDDITTGWSQCTGPSCAGGTGNPTSTSQTFGNTPSLDSGSMLLQESGPASSNNGWFYNAGKNNAATGFTLDLQFNIPPGQNIQALEFDQFQYLFAGDGGVTANTRLFFGTQCLPGHNWQVWDSSGNGFWVDTGMACNYVVSSTAFNHLIIAVHRVAGDTSCLNSYPCMYYTITLNGTLIVPNKKTNSGALPSTFGEQTGLMIQLDTSSGCGSACTIREYIDNGIFLATNIPWWPAIQQILLDD